MIQSSSPLQNRLAQEKSPYLLQHADNPVAWMAWNEEAFAKARAENKPIFLSVGYSTCHWCHVMAHESFEDEATAEIMNREFVNIKVDREERPDVDRIYMTFVQATSGHGGWPMSVWLTPELKPFVGGTYFPPEDRYGHPGFKSVLQRIAAAWKQDRRKITEQGTRIIEALQEASTSPAPEGGSLGEETLVNAYAQIARSYDAEEGGFGGAPKFPRPVMLNFLLRIYAREAAQVFHLPAQERANWKLAPRGKHALEMVLFTLRKMAAGGMHDQLGGGFSRYSVDAYWHVPHFEKMLYDQAQLASAYLDAFQITREPVFERVARDILDYVRGDMTAPEGGFYSAEDADSVIAHGKPDHAEGAFYVWSKNQVDEALEVNAEIFNFHYGVEADGNAPPGADPHGEFVGKNILIERHTLAETAEHFAKEAAEVETLLAASRETLRALRQQRPRPHLDDKIITAWNGLMISAFARGAQVLEDATYLAAAEKAARCVRTLLYDETRGTLVRNYREGRSAVEAFADDYAFVIQGLLDLYEASFEVEWFKFALDLQATQDRLFYDHANGGYFSGTGADPSILLRMKEDNDGAEPAASSIAASNLLRLAQIRADETLRARAEKTIAAFSATLMRGPSAMPQMLVALAQSLGTGRQIVIAGTRNSEETRALLREVHRHFIPDKVLLLADGGEGEAYLAEKLEALKEMKPRNGKATAYVCENFTCQAPVNEPVGLRALL
ncbi:MAG TPA: thioredoxin domain-containing protein [Chthoniobacterales bacterium]|nr:thioredoxin domain-containing protein [Chthoniobacterales bacterium]